jgi:AraC-like DNA-binding protein
MIASERDFASAAMIRVLAAGLSEQGLSSPMPQTESARVPIEDKLSLVQSVLTSSDPAVILAAGRAVRRFPQDPTVRALLSGGTPWSLIERWGRLEAYVHSSHRTRRTPVTGLAPGRIGVDVEHYALRNKAAPHPLETLAVVAVLGGLLAMIGAEELTLVCADKQLLPESRSEDVLALIEANALQSCRFEWRDHSTEHIMSHVALPDSIEAESHLSAQAAAIVALIQTDTMRTWRLGDVASHLGLSTRTLQRALSSQSTSFTELLALGRLRRAASLLIHSQVSLVEVGYLCGYADQAHFCRSFERNTGVSPGRYRRDFGHAPTQ